MPEVEQILLCYKACKKSIKGWAQDSCSLDKCDREKAFVATLCTHLRTFNSKWEERELACKGKFAELQQQVRAQLWSQATSEHAQGIFARMHCRTPDNLTDRIVSQ
jgi:hypothetical protein